MGFLDYDGLQYFYGKILSRFKTINTTISEIETTLGGKSDSNHVHNYAGSSSPGGSATSAVKLDTSAGSETNPVYFKDGKPVKTTYTLSKSVPSNAVFTDTTYKEATTSVAGLMPATDKSKLDNIEDNANNYTLPTASSTLGGVKTTSTVTSATGYTACPIISGVPYYKDTNTTYTLSSFGITATAAEINKLDGVTATTSELNILDGVTATTTELNYVDGVTSNIQTQLNNKVPITRTVNGKALSGNISLTYSDVGADASGSASSALASAKSYADTSSANALSAAKEYNDTAYANAKSYTDTSISNLINGAPTTLDTLKEIADAMSEHEEVVDALEEAIGTKQDTITGGATTITSSNLTASRALISNSSGKVAVSAVTSTELGYLDGVTSAIQTQLNNKSDSGHTHSYAASSTVGGSATSAVKLDSSAGSATQPVYFKDGKPVATTYTLSASVPSGAKFTDTVYTHPSYTAKSSGFYKITVDATGHVSATTAVTKSDITGLGIPGSDTTYSAATTSALGLVKIGSNITVSSGTISLTKSNVTSALGYTPPTTNTTYSAATTETDGLMSAADKTKLDNIDDGANNYTLPTASSTLGGVKTTSTVTSASGYTACPIISGIPYYKDTITTYSAATTSALGLVKIGSNITVSSGTISLTKANVTSALGYTPPTTNTTYSAATTETDGLMSAADKIKLDGITGTGSYILPVATSGELGGVKIGYTESGKNYPVELNSSYQMYVNVPWENSTYTLSSFGVTATAAELNILDGVTATAAEINKLDGLTATTTELNYVDGVTSNIQTQLDNKAASSHGTHVTYGTSTQALGTASAGTASTVSRSDHVHALPALTSCTGTLTVAKGGTGATTASDARTNLGLGTAATYSVTTSATSGSSALITSGAVYTALEGKLSTSGGTFTGTISSSDTSSLLSAHKVSGYTVTGANYTGGAVDVTSVTAKIISATSSATINALTVTTTASVGADTNYTNNQLRNTVFITEDPGAGVETTYANGSIIAVYE